jgi:hypothetical protein
MTYTPFDREAYDLTYSTSKDYKQHYNDMVYADTWRYIMGKLCVYDKLLDIGCGPGHLAHMLYDNGFKNYTGIDFSDVAIKMARAKVPSYNFIKDDLRTINYSKYYDYKIICTEALEHIENDIDLLKKLPPNYIIFSVPDFMTVDHYRTYKNEKFIKEYYKNVLNILTVKTFPVGNGSSIHAVEAIILFDSKKYWEDRYKNGDDSGIGSKGILSEYKASVINEFVIKNNIQTVCELGCGDTQFTLYNIPDFTGYDISNFIIEKNRKIYDFKFTSSLSDLSTYDLVISLDVIYHLIEDDVYHQHMKDLFNLSKKYVIIYSPNREEFFSAPHNRYREFLKDVPKEFILKTLIENPNKGNLTQSDFYIFEKL